MSFLCVVGRQGKADAADLVQQTFSELLQTLARRRELEIRRPRSFLFKLAARQLYAARKRNDRQPATDFDAPVSTLLSADVRDDVEHSTLLRTEQRLLLRAMRTLQGSVGTALTGSAEVSPLQLLVYFRFWIGLTLDEVAEIFEVTPGVISGRQRLALQLLQQRIEEIARKDRFDASTSTTMLFRWRDMLEQEARAPIGRP